MNKPNTQYAIYGELARKECNKIEGAGKKRDHLTLYALVTAHEQAALSNNVNIKEAAFIDGTLHRKQKTTALDTILKEVFGFEDKGVGKDYYTNADVQSLKRMLPVAAYLIEHGGTKAVIINDSKSELSVNEELVNIATDNKGKKVALNGVEKRTVTTLRTVATRYWGVRNEDKRHSEVRNEGQKADKNEKVVALDNLPKTIEIITSKIRQTDVDNISPLLNAKLQELLIELIGMYGEKEAMEIYMKDAA